PPPLARAATRLRGAAPPDPGVGRPRPPRPTRQDLRVPLGRTADPRRRPARRRRRETRARHGRRRGRPLRRRGCAAGGAARPPPALEGGKPRRHAALGRVAQAPLAGRARRGARGPAEEPRLTAAALTAERAIAVPRTQERIVKGLFFASLFVATFEKVHWNVAGQIGLNDITSVLFLIAD